MASLGTLVVELFANIFELLVATARIALRDPLSFVSVLVGGALFAVSFLLPGYLLAGAILDAVADAIGSPGRPPQRAR